LRSLGCRSVAPRVALVRQYRDLCHALAMSVYRTVKRSPRSDVHHVAEHVGGPKRSQRAVIPSSQEPATVQRKPSQTETLLAATERWMASLPVGVRPATIARNFPHIANALAELWGAPAQWRDYFGALLVDQRAGRKGFPLEILRELQALWVHYSTLHPEGPGMRSPRK